MKIFLADIKTLTADQGGRRVPFFDGYEPHLEINGKKIKAMFLF